MAKLVECVIRQKGQEKAESFGRCRLVIDWLKRYGVWRKRKGVSQAEWKAKSTNNDFLNLYQEDEERQDAYGEMEEGRLGEIEVEDELVLGQRFLPQIRDGGWDVSVASVRLRQKRIRGSVIWQLFGGASSTGRYDAIILCSSTRHLMNNVQMPVAVKLGYLPAITFCSVLSRRRLAAGS